MDTAYKFSTGILKGRPLNSTGMSYKIVRRGNEDVAQFANGSMARFYRDMTEPQTAKQEAAPSRCELVPEMPTPKAEPCNEFERLLTEMNSGDMPAAVNDSFLPKPKQTLAVYKQRNGQRPRHTCDPVYCVLENGGVLYSVDRHTVGTGLREFLWLYEKLRLMGRGCFTALLEARMIYFQ